MRTTLRYIVIALTGAAVLGGCNRWLDNPEAVKNPNQPTSANINQLFVSIQTNTTVQYTSDLARTVCVWMQQCAGTDRQFKQLGVYVYGEDSYNAPFSDTYTGGGLVDVRRVEALADSSGDKVYGGIARVMEVMLVGLAADIWGDIPYSEAVNPAINFPKLDPQQQVYATLQAKLDTAVTFLATGQGPGPGGIDLVYGGDATKWLHLAHTLKARYYLHVVEKLGPVNYDSALAQAQQGLQKGEDYRTFQAATTNSFNMWYQFVVIQRSGYMNPGAFLVNLLKARNDPRLQQYFAPAQAGGFQGANPGQQAAGDPTISPFNPARIDPAFRQPVVTWAENQMIIAEAALQRGNSALALSATNAVRADAGLPALSSVTLADVMTEKYIALFQTTEVWNDYKRTCLPVLTPAPGSTQIPGRLLYAESERVTNPQNIPAPGAQPARNWNDPNACT